MIRPRLTTCGVLTAGLLSLASLTAGAQGFPAIPILGEDFDVFVTRAEGVVDLRPVFDPDRFDRAIEFEFVVGPVPFGGFVGANSGRVVEFFFNNTMTDPELIDRELCVQVTAVLIQLFQFALGPPDLPPRSTPTELGIGLTADWNLIDGSQIQVTGATWTDPANARCFITAEGPIFDLLIEQPAAD